MKGAPIFGFVIAAVTLCACGETDPATAPVAPTSGANFNPASTR